MLRRFLVEGIARNLRKPENGMFGIFIKNFLKKRNRVLELAAASLSEIEPHHKVLEIAFGPGLGLKYAHTFVKDGPGHITGVDFSEAMLKEAGRYLAKEIQAGKVELHYMDAASLNFPDSHFDRVFHVNAYYFWPDQKKVAQEMYRVMKPGGRMVTTLNITNLKVIEDKGFMKYGNTNPDRFMESLKAVGFKDVRLESKKDNGNFKYEAIFACVKEDK